MDFMNNPDPTARPGAVLQQFEQYQAMMPRGTEVVGFQSYTQEGHEMNRTHNVEVTRPVPGLTVLRW